MTCACCDDCAFVQPNVPPDIHEIHLTIEAPESMASFITMCHNENLKPVALDLNGTMNDIMTTSRFRGTEEDALKHVENVKTRVELFGFKAIRTKIETSLTNPISQMCSGGGYFESHIALNMRVEEKPELLELIEMFKKIGIHGIHVSNNMFKQDVQMVTIRSYKGYRDWHLNKIGVFLVSLQDNKYDIKKIIHEYCWHDTNVNHDERWINA